MLLEYALPKVSKGISLHVPGHKNNTIGTLESISTAFDLTEVEGLDNLHEPRGVLKELNECLGALYGCYAQLMVNGTTTGILASIHALNNTHTRFFLIGDAHKSVFNALALIDKKSHFYNHNINQLKKGDVVIITSPTYDGDNLYIKNIIEMAQSKGCFIIVDEAHGAHFGITDNFPDSACKTKADVVIQSYHKMLPALTGASVVFVKHKEIYSILMRYINMFESSSPNYLVMLSIEHALNFYLNYDDSIFFKKRSSLIKHLRKNNYLVQTLDDPAKLLINITNISPYDLEESFRKRGIYSEMVTERGVLWCLPLWHENDLYPFDKLLKQIEAVEIVNQKLVSVDLSSLQNVRAVETITPYPPGIPVILRNDKISDDILETIQRLIQRNVKIEGLSQNLNYYNK